MFKSFLNIFRIPELRNKFLFTLAMLCIYRVGFHIPIPGINQIELQKQFANIVGDEKNPAGRLIEYVGLFTGGNLRQASLFGLGIMPYISAAIIFQLLGTVVPSLEKLQKEGETGRQKINEYTRYLTVGLCVLQAIFYVSYLSRSPDLVYPEYKGQFSFWMMGILGMTTGTIFMMWLGEQVDQYGLGNGISLIIMAGIVARLPQAVAESVRRFNANQMGWDSILMLVVSFIFVVAGSILITQGQRRIPIQQAKRMRGRRVYGGQRQYLPLRVNHGGVMPIIFASSLMLLPTFLFSQLSKWFNYEFTRGLAEAFTAGNYIYELTYVVMIFFFAYFWTTVQFQPKEMANQLRDYGSFIPGLRPGRRTAEYLEQVMGRITYVGAAFLSVIAVIPSLAANLMGVPFSVSAFLGGTGLLIMVSVALDLIQRIEANLVMRNYSGFLGEKGAKIKGAYV
ncbi:MAG: Protein translocase subunit SecY [Phycisphaerae bacterium]|nr:Protein translocase subunit SecY [Phycisphaerae bacterium]